MTPPRPCRSRARRIASYSRAALALCLVAAPTLAGDLVDWVPGTGAVVDGDALTLTVCLDGAGDLASASFVAPHQGTYVFDLAARVDRVFGITEFRVSVDGKLVLYTFDWCGSDCQQVLEDLQFHVGAGSLVTFRLDNTEGECFAGGMSVDVVGIAFRADLGAGPVGGALDGSRLGLIDAPSGVSASEFGTALASLPDVDGDGVSDFAVSDRTADVGPASEVGMVAVLSGATHTPLYVLPGVDFFGWFGHALASVGDCDDDGVGDLVVGAPLENGPLSNNQGRVTLYSGKTGAELWTLRGEGSFDEFGSVLRAAGDVDGDGAGDVFVGEPRFGDEAGRITLRSGRDGSILHAYAGPAKSHTGFTFDVLADRDGDGVPDLVLGAFVPDGPPVPDARTVKVVSTAQGTTLLELDGPETTATFTAQLVTAGDVDGDGLDDFVLGALVGDDGQGLVELHAGSDGEVRWTATGAPGEEFGLDALARAGDRDGDGVPDLLVGSPFSHGSLGALSILSGDDGALLAEHVGRPPLKYLGLAAALVPDTDGDGDDDVLVSPLLVAKKVEIVSGRLADHVAPRLVVLGEVAPGGDAVLRLDRGDPLGAAVLVFGLDRVDVPFKDGVLVPSTDALGLVMLDADGVFAQHVAWPADLPSYASFFVQAWLPDDDGFVGWLASDALQVVVPPSGDAASGSLGRFDDPRDAAHARATDARATDAAGADDAAILSRRADGAATRGTMHGTSGVPAWTAARPDPAAVLWGRVLALAVRIERESDFDPWHADAEALRRVAPRDVAPDAGVLAALDELARARPLDLADYGALIAVFREPLGWTAEPRGVATARALAERLPVRERDGRALREALVAELDQALRDALAARVELVESLDELLLTLREQR
ncbi:MAG: FG-GAP repeat protein [Planctomycetes bacterium]|nr:FG-GAP repeat protein [Planctomycetota bacterium]